MSVDTRSQEYRDNQKRWQLVRDAIAGEEVIKKRGEGYLPRPSGMDNKEWKAYAARPHWFGATGRTAEGLHGMIFSKPPVLKDCPEALAKLLEDIDRQGNNLDQFASDVTWDSLPTNLGGILVDYPESDSNLDRKSAEAAGLRAYAARYSAESVINWRWTTKDNQLMLSLVVLHEPYEKPGDDKFTTTIKNRYRVLSLDDEGNYQQEVYDDNSTEGLSVAVSTYNPHKNGQMMKYIPFFPLPSKNPDKSMLHDLACENVGHYQKMADYENGLHLTGIPTPYASCVAPRDDKGNLVEVKLGGNSFLWLGDPQATAGYLEFTGQGLATLEKAIQNCEERMAILGARIISAEKKGVESAEAARIHRAGENSILASFALNLSDVLTAVIREIGEWEGIPGSDKVTYSLNTSYDLSQMDPQLFTAWTNARLSNLIPDKVYFNKLQANGDVPPETSYEDWLKQLDADGMNHGPDGDE